MNLFSIFFIFFAISSFTSDSREYPHLCFMYCRCADDKPFEPTYQVSQERARSLGINFIPVEVSLNDTVESLKEKKFFSLWLLEFNGMSPST